MSGETSKKRCVIAIPVWKRLISENELVSLIQCICVLGSNPDYEIVLFGPERLDAGYYSAICGRIRKQKIEIVKFDDSLFESRLSYSHLLSSKEFYGRFSDYEYMLIYQLDAWVTADKLSEWCDKGYDYIGAPWCHFCRMCHVGTCHGYESESMVGNGGLSLRRIDTFMNRLPYETVGDALYGHEIPEDVYISLFREISRPRCDEACRFSVETNAKMLIGSKMEGDLPFGFHGLRIYDIELCEDIISSTFVGADILDRFKNEMKNA